MILRQLRDIKNDTDDILVYGFDGTNNQKISTDINGKLDIVSVNLDIALSTLKTVLDNIDANTDTLEAKTQSIRDQLDVTLSTRASESTAQDILNALGVFSGTNILSELQNLTTSGLATDATLIQVRDYLDTVEIKLQDIINRLDVNLSTRASEATSIEIRDTIGQESGNTVLSKLTDLKDAIDNLELTVDNVNINTDELEAKVQSVRDQLDVLLSTRASEATTQAILNALGQESGTTLLDEIQSLISNLGSEDFATETTLIQVRDYLDTVETKLQTIINALDVNLSTRASETTLSSVLSQLDITLSALRDAIKGANNKDLSTLEADIESILAQLDVDLSTRASESTLQSLLNAVGEISGTNLLSELQNILSQLDVALSTRASEATLLLVKSNLDDVKTKLDTLLAIDFATEATSVEIRDTIGQESGSTVLSKLQNLEDKLDLLFLDGEGKTKIWDGHKQANISAFNLLKTSTETPLAGYRWSQSVIDDSFTQEIEGIGSVDLVESTGLRLQSGASTNSGIIFTSNDIFTYSPGVSQIVKFSIVLEDSGVDGNIREWGVFTDTNGVFVRLNGLEYEFVIRSNGTETVIPASSWDIPVSPDPNGHLWYIQYQWLGVGNFFLYYDENIVHTYNFLGTQPNASMQIPDLPVRFTNTNTTNSSNVNLKNYCTAVFSEGYTIIAGLDETNLLRQIRTTTEGRLLVSTQTPIAPPSTTPVFVSEFGNVLTTIDTTYLIPSGTVLTITQFSAGAEVDTTAGNSIELYYDPLGTGIGMTLIDVIFASGSSNQHSIALNFTGDGTALIRLRRKRFSGGSKTIFGRWDGYYQ